MYRSYSFTHSILVDSRETGEARKRKDESPHVVWKKKMGGGRARKLKVSFDATQT